MPALCTSMSSPCTNRFCVATLTMYRPTPGIGPSWYRHHGLIPVPGSVPVSTGRSLGVAPQPDPPMVEDGRRATRPGPAGTARPGIARPSGPDNTGDDTD